MTADRIAATFAACAKQGRAAFVGYLMAGAPDIETSFSNIKALVDSGVDIIELGAPFTDPMADGPAIQKAALILRHGHDLGVDEIAAVLDVGVETVKTHLKRARARVRTDLGVTDDHR